MAPESDHHVELSLGEIMLGSLIDDAHTLHPDELVHVVRRKGALAGLDDIVVLLADRDQRTLRPLQRSDGDEDASVDGSMAGRAYQRSEVVLGDVDDDGSRTAWFPILDGTSRLGVMSARISQPDALALGRGRQLAGLVAFLVIAKRAHGDEIVRTFNAKELTLAADMRWATLPPLAFEHGSVAIGAMVEPAYAIAGDTFDYALDGDTLHLAIFDAMGHGLGASQLATLAVSAYRQGRRARLPLDELYRHIDAIVAAEHGPDQFVTGQLVTLDLATGHLECINAGHPRPLLLRGATKVVELAYDACLPIGLGARDLEVTDTSLEPGDTLLFLSDGVVEARTPDGEQFGIDRLGDLLVRAAEAELMPAEIVRRAAHAVVEHQGGTLEDDATLLLVTWRGNGR